MLTIIKLKNAISKGCKLEDIYLIDACITEKSTVAIIIKPIASSKGNLRIMTKK